MSVGRDSLDLKEKPADNPCQGNTPNPDTVPWYCLSFIVTAGHTPAPALSPSALAPLFLSLVRAKLPVENVSVDLGFVTKVS